MNAPLQTPEQLLERRIVWGLMQHLNKHGFTLSSVYDGKEHHNVDNPVAAMKAIFSIPEAQLVVTKRGAHTVKFILGNGVDCVSDFSYNINHDDGFPTAMYAFDPEQFVLPKVPTPNQFTLTIDTSNAAFGTNTSGELGRILDELAGNLARKDVDFPCELYDRYGNFVGNVNLT